jgi:hypothetical protein
MSVAVRPAELALRTARAEEQDHLARAVVVGVDQVPLPAGFAASADATAFGADKCAEHAGSFSRSNRPALVACPSMAPAADRGLVAACRRCEVVCARRASHTPSARTSSSIPR